MAGVRRRTGRYFTQKGPKRVNDKLIVNYNVVPTTTEAVTSLYDATINAVTITRIIYTGTIKGTSVAPAFATEQLGLIIIVARQDTVGSGQNIANGMQQWPNDKAVLYQGIWTVGTFGTDTGITLQIDVRGMRKLAIGDAIEAHTRAGTAEGDIVITGCFTIFGKLA